MPLTKNTSHLNHESITKYTWSPNLDTTRYQAQGSATYKADSFSYGDTADTPHHSEYTYSLANPKEWAGRITNKTVVHTGGGTNIAMYTHHTVTRPKFPPGSVRLGTFTLSQYLPKEDEAVKELHLVVEKVEPALTDLLKALEGYHLYSPDGWITSAGFIACCNKVKLSLLRSEFLALERSVPKDKMGRINYYHIAEVVEAVNASNVAEDHTSTAPEAVGTLRSTIKAVN
ncbi:hypothetical protein CEUSTIGMA_g415.t1 [Chlamydomonas eustigma]|uniref:Uncharacterized protein n=1 Tax=Chlamydomonas eustigma TaxID=1157962 RepID=A0A250WQY0_9CHLO|nr:hypothetical protein CEUSTIGMA_g415.t1 [Chlamydomonas eustigma]|eukprot:GAX72960.1 hypothetical protein CEUSTIGMA_g415.t1 [Chlamydomonas eustigma]